MKCSGFKKLYWHSAFLLGLIYVMGASCPALADEEAEHTTDPVCGNWIAETLQTLADLERLIPLVPQDEKTYLSQELGEAVAANSLVRINAVRQRPLYRAWNLRTEFSASRLRLKSLPSPLSEIKFRIKMASSIPYQVTRAARAWHEYIEADEAVKLTFEQVESGSRKMEEAMDATAGYIWCLADQIHGER